MMFLPLNIVPSCNTMIFSLIAISLSMLPTFLASFTTCNSLSSTKSLLNPPYLTRFWANTLHIIARIGSSVPIQIHDNSTATLAPSNNFFFIDTYGCGCDFYQIMITSFTIFNHEPTSSFHTHHAQIQSDVRSRSHRPSE